MKITHQTTTIDQVKQGECFRVENIYYMATGTYLTKKDVVSVYILGI